MGSGHSQRPNQDLSNAAEPSKSKRRRENKAINTQDDTNNQPSQVAAVGDQGNSIFTANGDEQQQASPNGAARARVASLTAVASEGQIETEQQKAPAVASTAEDVGDVRKQVGISSDSVNGEQGKSDEYWAHVLEGATSEPFPDLSGLRNRAKSAGVNQVSTAVPDGSKIEQSILEAAWAFLLHAYAEAEEPEVVFGTATGPRRLRNANFNLTNVGVVELLKKADLEARAHADIAGLPFDTAIYFGKPAKYQDHLAVCIVYSGDRLDISFSEQVLSPAAATCVLQQLIALSLNISSNPSASFLNNTAGLGLELQAALNPKPEHLTTPDGELLHSAFERNVSQKPDAVALWFKGEDGSEVKWTYAELNAYANRLANAILAAAPAGGIVDTAIPLCLEKTPELYVAILGVLKASAAWCPIDPTFPPLRKRDLITRAGGSVVLVRTGAERDALVAEDSLPSDREVVVLAIADILADTQEVPTVPCNATPSTLAYLIWTSGTTGAPKGVPIEHSAAVQSIAALHQDLPYSNADAVRCIQFSAFTFDVSVQDFFYTWGAPAGTLCSASRSLLLGSFPQLCNTFEVTHAFLTPAFMATTSLAACPTIRTLTSIGEKLPDAVADAWCAEGVVSVNTYGPAESTIVSTVRTWTPGEAIKAHNVGRPLTTISCFAVEGDRILPRGAAGELAIGGHQNARGYLAQPDKAAAKFVDHPLAGKVYLTGDVVRILHDGTIEFVGRTDDLVKLGGVRVELSEISALIATDKYAWGPVATLQLSRPDRPQKVICSFIAASQFTGSPGVAVVSPEAAAVALEAKDSAKATLPSYMVPNVFLVLPRIPTTASNKIDRTALAKAYAEVDLGTWEALLGDGHVVDDDVSDGERAAFDAVRTAVSKLTGVPMDNIDGGTPLNALGVDSIRAIQLAVMLKDANLGREVAVLDILEHPTARGLAKFIISLNNDADAMAAVNGQIQTALAAFNNEWFPRVQEQLGGDSNVEMVLPCLPLQEGTLSERMVHHRAYWSHTALKLQSGIDLARLKAAWQQVSDATDILRVGFLLPAGEIPSPTTFVQLLFKSSQINWAEVPADGRSLKSSIEHCSEEVMRKAVGSARPPWALNIVYEDNVPTLIFSAHHAIYDANTINMLFADVAAAYENIALPARPSLLDVVTALTLTSDAQSAAIDFWKARLAPFADPEAHGLPDLTGKARPAETVKTGHIAVRLALSLPPDALADAARSMGGSLSHLVAVAWSVVVGAYTETSKVVFGETLTARRNANAVGPLLSVTPAAVNLVDGATASTAVKELAQFSIDAVPHRGVQLRSFRDALARPAGKNLWDAMFVLHPDAGEEHDYRGLWSIQRDVAPLYVEHGWALNVGLHPDRVELEFGADAGMMAPAQLDLLVQQIDAVVSAIAANPNVPLNQVLTKHIPLTMLSTSAPPCPDNVRDAKLYPVTDSLEKFAKEHPDWTAAIFATRIESDGADTVSWTYKELDDTANRVANFILSKNFRNATIAFCMARSLESFAYQVGIFKTGNCYLPVEEDLPPARKLLLVSDSSAVIIFTTADIAPQFANVAAEVQVVIVDGEEHVKELAQQSAVKPRVEYNQHAPGYLLYTSGSTGKPKGCLISHGNFSSYIETLYYLASCYCPPEPFLGAGRWLGRTSIAFDVHLLEIFTPWRFGMATVGAPRHIVLADLGNTLRHLKISHCSLVPSLLERSGLLPKDVPLLRFATVGGEKISVKVVEDWGNDPDGLLIFNAYGPTEVTIGCTAAKVTATSSPRDIGFVYPGSKAFVYVSGTTDLAVRGQPGELCIAGDLVGIGYLNRPDAGGFTTGHDGSKIYRTGDIVRMLADDTIEYLGRGDDQTKIRGQRLELAEVNACLAAAMKDSAVASMVSQHPSMKRDMLLAFVSTTVRACKDDEDRPKFTELDPEARTQLTEYCRERLPAYMVPDIIMMVDFIPVALISRKVDAKILRKLFETSPLEEVMGTAVPKRDMNELELQILDIIRQFAPIHGEVNPSTTTTNIGLDSLAIIRLGARLASVGMAVPVSFLAIGPSIEGIARKVRSTTAPSTEEHSRSALAAICKDLAAEVHSTLPAGLQVATVLPCLPLQSSLITRSLDAPSSLYVNHVILQLTGSVGDELLVAVRDIIKTNDILRTSFHIQGTQIVQLVLVPDSYPDPTSICALGSGEESVPSAELTAIADDIVASISTIPPIRATLWRGSDRSFFVLSMHHSIYDGESIPMLLSDIEQRGRGKPALARTQFAAMLEYHTNQDRKAAEKFFADYLDDLAPQPELPVVEDPQDYATISVTLDTPLDQIEDRSRATGVGLHPLAQAAFAAALAEQLKANDLVIGVVLSGRAIALDGVEFILGPCVTTVPTRFRLTSTTLLLGAARAMQKYAENLFTYQHTSIQDIQKWTGYDAALFGTLFSFTRGQSLQLDETIWKEQPGQYGIDYPMAMEVAADAAKNTLTVSISCLTQLRPTAEAIVHRTADFLRKPNQPVKAGQGLQVAREPRIQYDEHTWDDIEVIIRARVAEICEVDESLVTKNVAFLRLGLDSINSIRLAQLLRSSGLIVRSSDILRFPTVGSLANRVGKREGDASSNNLVAAFASTSQRLLDAHRSAIRLLDEHDTIQRIVPATALQTAMLTSTLSSAGALYVVPHTFELDASTDIKALKAAFATVVDERSILRTSFSPDEEYAWLAVEHQTAPLAWEEKSTPDDEVAVTVTEVASRLQLTEPEHFDQPPFRLAIILTPVRRLLVLVMHHALYDGTSLSYIFDDVGAAILGRSLPLRPQFHEALPFINEVSTDAHEFWRKMLSGYRPVNLESKSSPSMMKERFASLPVASIERSCQMMEVTVQAAAMLAWSKVYASVCGTADVVFGHVVSGRSIPLDGALDVAGPLFNTVPVRIIHRDDGRTNDEVVKDVHESIARMERFHHTPLRQIVSAWRRDTAGNRLFDALFVFQRVDHGSSSVTRGELPWTVFDASEELYDPEYSVNAEVEYGGEQLVLRLGVKAGTIPESMLDPLLDSFDLALTQIFEEQSAPAIQVPGSLPAIPTVQPESESETPMSTDRSSAADFDEALTASEVALARVVCDVAKITPDLLRRRTPFYTVGIDSISAMQVVARAKRAGVELAVSDLVAGLHLEGTCAVRDARLARKTSSTLNGKVVSQEAEDQALSKLGITAADIEIALPALPGQQYHLVAWLKGGRTFYELPFAFTAVQPLDAERLAAAWVELRKRHHVLRTIFAAVGQDLVQVILTGTAIVAPDPTLRFVTATGDLAQAVEREIQAELSRPSDLRSPPVRAVHVRAEQQDAFVLILHHALYDAWSLPLLLADFVHLYNRDAADSLSLANFPELVQQVVQTTDLKSAPQYWSEYLATARPTLVEPSNDALGPSFVFEPNAFDDISPVIQAAGKHQLATSTVFLIALARAVRHTLALTAEHSPSSLLVGLFQTGRSVPMADIDRVAGPALTLLPVAIPVADEVKINDAVRTVQEALATRPPFEQTSVADIARWVGIEVPLFNVYFNILWHSDRMWEQPETTSLLKPLELADYLFPEQPIQGSTAIDGIDTSFIAKDALNIDIALNPGSQSVAVGLRAEGALAGHVPLHAIVTRLKEEVEAIVQELQ